MNSGRFLEKVKYEYEIPIDLMIEVMGKDPKEPWYRFTENLNQSEGTNFTEGFLRIVRAVAEDAFDCVGKSSQRLSIYQFDAIMAGLGLEKTHSEIASFVGVSPSTVSRFARIGKNLERSQIKKNFKATL